MKYVTWLMSLLLFLSALTASAQQVIYTFKSGDMTGSAIIDYREDGYTLWGGGPAFIVIETKKHLYFTLGDGLCTVFLDGPFLHGNLGKTKKYPLVTSDGQRGEAQVRFVGIIPEGHKYTEELRIDGRLISQSMGVYDDVNQIVWMETITNGVTLRFDRKK